MSLVLIRHGQSIWNLQQRFTGWVDVPLTRKGEEDAVLAGQTLRHIRFDAIYVSTLMRAKQTVLAILAGQQETRAPIFRANQLGVMEDIYCEEARDEALFLQEYKDLNERCYGALQGFHKPNIIEKYGKDQVQRWRRGVEDMPPSGESLTQTLARVKPLWQNTIAPQAKTANVLVCAHGNSLRALIQCIEAKDIKLLPQLEIATAVPKIYAHEKGQWSEIHA